MVIVFVQHVQQVRINSLETSVFGFSVLKIKILLQYISKKNKNTALLL